MPAARGLISDLSTCMPAEPGPPAKAGAAAERGRLAAAVDQAAEAILTTDRGGHVTYANLAFSHIVPTLQAAPTITEATLTSFNRTQILLDWLAVIALIDRGQPQDLTSAKLIADTLVYALGHDNQGDSLPALAGTAALHNGMFAGDIALFNSQAPQGGQRGQVRLSGFTASVVCPQTGFCLDLDGATGGNNAFAILGLLAAYRQFQSPGYLNAALTIGN